MGLQTFGQTQINKLEPEQYFDFWIGEWELTWETPSGINNGGNIITKLLDNKVIQEEFWVINDPNMNEFKGRSWSVYNAYSGAWKQIWVDNQGSFFEFTAEFEGNNRIFKREIVKSDGSKILQRMVFYDI